MLLGFLPNINSHVTALDFIAFVEDTTVTSVHN